MHSTRVGCDGFEKLPLILAPVSGIAVGSSLITVQEVWQLLAVMHIARSHTGAVYQTRRLPTPICTFIPKCH